MKKFFIIALTICMAISLIGCSKQSDNPNWPEGTYFDKDQQTMMTVELSQDIDHPGWQFSIVGKKQYTGYAGPQEDNLQGEIVRESEAIPFTVSKEGKGGCAVKLANGEEYHFAYAPDLTVVGTVSLSRQGNGQVTYAVKGEEIVFGDEAKEESYQFSVWEVNHYTFAAQEDEGWKFQHWKLNGDLLSQEKQIELYVDKNMELKAVFTKQ